MNAIRKAEDDKKPVDLNLEKRKAYRLSLEDKTLQAENARRAALGEAPYPNWTAYQAAEDAKMEHKPHEIWGASKTAARN